MLNVVDQMTERLLVDAGIGPGLRVLDVGCGQGIVSVMAARLVGERGQVVGIDRDAGALTAARTRAAELGQGNVTFVEGDFRSVSSDHGRFDAAIGRRVLMYQEDGVAAIRGLITCLKPGGLVVFQEHDATMVPGRVKPLPLYERVLGWMWTTVQREGGNVHMGFDLAAVLSRAGLVVEQVRAEGVVQTPTSHYAVGEIVRAIMPRIVRHGVATEAEIDVATLDQRLRAEREQADATCISDMVFGAWARRPQ